MFKQGHVIDLTRVMDEDLDTFVDGDYSDPQLALTTWCTTQERGFCVSKLELGTQTGTHIDAPAHFAPEGDTLESLDLGDLLGPYFHVDATEMGRTKSGREFLRSYAGESILFLASATGRDTLEPAHLDALASLSCNVWVTAGTVEIAGQDGHFFHRFLADRGLYLIEDLDPAAARSVRPGGQFIALPLRLVGVSGSPCRVLVIQGERGVLC